MNKHRVNTLWASFREKFKSGIFGTTQPKYLRNMWRRFKGGYHNGLVTPAGELVQSPKAHQLNVLAAMGYSEEAIKSFAGLSKTKLRRFIRRKNTRVVSITEVGVE